MQRVTKVNVFHTSSALPGSKWKNKAYDIAVCAFHVSLAGGSENGVDLGILSGLDLAWVFSGMEKG